MPDQYRKPVTGESFVSTFYDRVLLSFPWISLALILLAAGWVMSYIPHFEIEASGDTLVLQQDEDLRYYREISHRYERQSSVIVTYQPEGDLLSEESLERLTAVRSKLREVQGVESVVSILDVPLLKNPPGPLSELEDRIKTLEDPGVNKEMARKELRNSPLYRDALVSSDLTVTAMQVNFETNERYEELQKRRLELQNKMYQDGGLSGREKKELERVTEQYQRMQRSVRENRQTQIDRLRSILSSFNNGEQFSLGGVPVIVDHIISYIKSDLRIFGIGILVMLALMLAVLLRRVRWVVLPMMTCLLSAATMIGLLGFLGWEVTVVSSNFVSLQLIFTVALIIHVIVRYREVREKRPGEEEKTWISIASTRAFTPCLYAVLTTSAGFSSLLISGLLPVITFGWIMILGVFLSLLTTFLFLPAGLAVFPSTVETTPSQDVSGQLTGIFAFLTEQGTYAILVLAVLVSVVTAYGITQLRVENSFVDYFRSSSEVYQSLKFIDRKLGGTTPLDIIVSFGSGRKEEQETDQTGSDEDSDFSGFGEYASEPEGNRETYWYTVSKMERIERIHDYLDKQNETGKTRSLATLWKIGQDLSGGSIDTMELQIILDSMPETFKSQLLDAFVSTEQNQARITSRIIDSNPSLNRDAFLERVRTDLVEKGLIDEGQFRLTGLMVLYNDMLQSLFRSQVNTIGLTVLLIGLLLYVLFQSVRVALVAIVPNLISALTVLGIMGLAGIPLDLMTITIVAISVGIALDDTIHYLHRFREELNETGSYLKSMHRTHGSIGHALAYTTMAIVMGFIILTLSEFIPTVLFGLLTALAMVVALVSALTLLPALLLIVRPFEATG